MRKNVLKITVLLASITFIFFACNKDEILNNSTRDFENPKEEIGKLHNEQLKFVLENVDYVPENVSVKQYVEGILYSNESYSLKSATSLESIPDFPDNIEELDLNEWLNEFDISEELKSEILNTFDLFQTAQDLTDILEGIKQKEISASEIFQGAELDLYYEHLAVAKYTSIFWYPESEGGLNGIQYLNSSQLKSASSLKSTQQVNWWKVLGVDCVGGMMGGPGGYAGASAISVIMQL